MKQQIIVSGIGGQGVLFLTRVLAEAALEQGLAVLTAETHGMAMRGGTVISQVKIGGFISPLIRSGGGDVGLFLYHGNLTVHRHFMKPDGCLFVNTDVSGAYHHIDASGMARDQGAPVVMNLVLLGYAVGRGGVFCDAEVVERTIRKISRERYLELNMNAFRAGVEEAGKQREDG